MCDACPCCACVLLRFASSVAPFGAVQAVAEHLDDTQLLAIIFELFGELAFIQENLRTIIHFGGLRLLCDTIELYQHDALLMIKVGKRRARSSRRESRGAGRSHQSTRETPEVEEKR